MILEKELVDELIRITKKYYKTGEVDILPAMRKAEDALEQECKASYSVIRLIGDLAKFTQRSGKGTYKDTYKVLAIFGVEIE